ncbi:MAG: C45 family autoproteolytic acyltransferase/hydrolase [Clostridiales bacterium]|nr:C45 family autoproteolytic acyltransferase/hydrolase [Clostridiales bacterium]
MYHVRFKGSYYEAGFKFGKNVLKSGKKLDHCPTFPLTKETYAFAKECEKAYRKYYPELLEEIQGIADGNEVPIETLEAMLFSMYCIQFDNKCTCMALRSEDEIIFARNSDFLVSLEKLYMNCIYHLDESYGFMGNTTAFVQMEDGVNEHGLAVGLTFIYPKIKKPGFNCGMLVRYLLEKCKTTQEAIDALHVLPIASAQTLTIIDRTGDMVAVECNPKQIVEIRPEESESFVAAANCFHSKEMQPYCNTTVDDWRAEERYETAYQALKGHQKLYSVEYAESILAGEHGFMCQYDRKTNADTVWSVVYDLKRKRIYRVEGNPSRKPFKEDDRMKLSYA